MANLQEDGRSGASRLNRRDFTRVGGLGLLMAGGGAPAAIDFLSESLITVEFLRNATPLSPQEIKKLRSEHREEILPFDNLIPSSAHSLVEGSFQGNGSPVYLEFPGIEGRESRLNVFDVIVNDRRQIRTSVISSPEPKSKSIQLGPMSGKNTFRIIKSFEGREEPIDPKEVQPVLTYPLNHTFERIVDEGSPVFVPRRGRAVWDDAIARTVAVPYTQDGNYRLLYRKIATAENSRFRSLHDDTGRTYDDDLATLVEITPRGYVRNAYDQRADHATRQVNGIFLYGTHTVEEVDTDNGMIRSVQDYAFYRRPYLLDKPEIISADELTARDHFTPVSAEVDMELQGVSIDELLREGKIKPDDSIIVDFNKRVRRRDFLKGIFEDRS